MRRLPSIPHRHGPETKEPPNTTARRRATYTVLSAVAIVLAGSLAAVAFASAAERKQAAGRGTLTVQHSRYGRILFDGRGFALYGFTADKRRQSVCSGPCAAVWPPYIVQGAPRAGRGVKGSRLGTIRRADGTRQVAYAGRPLYYYTGDKRPGQILCQGVSEYGGDWLVVRPTGTLVR